MKVIKKALAVVLSLYILASIMPQIALANSNVSGRYEEVSNMSTIVKDAELHVYSTKNGGTIELTGHNLMGTTFPQVTGYREYTATPADGWIWKGWKYEQLYKGKDLGNRTDGIRKKRYSFSNNGSDWYSAYNGGQTISVNRLTTAGETVGNKITYKIYADFNPTINATATAGGTITNPGFTEVNYGDNKQYDITANNGQVIDSVFVDGQNISEAAGEGNYSYTFEDVREPHTIVVTFRQNTQDITLSFDGNATDATNVPESMIQKVVVGTNASFDRPAQTPTRQDYTFVGWSESPDGTSIVEWPYSTTGSKTLYAVWKTSAPTPDLKYGSLTVNKVVVMPEGDNTSVTDKEYTFTIKGQGGSYNKTTTVKIGDGNSGSVTLENVPVGEYTVTESNAGIAGYDVVTVSNPADGKVTVKEQAASIEFTNTYTKTEEPKGALTINKTVKGLPNEILPASFTFEIKQGENAQAVTVNREGNDNTYKSETVQLPYGTYTISEVNADVYGFNLNPTGLGEVTIDKEHKEVTVNVTNDYEPLPPNTGTIIVKKTVSGNASSTSDEFKFKVTVLTSPEPDPSGPPIAMSANANAVKAPAASTVNQTATQDNFVKENGIWTLRFTLKGGEKMTISNLPVDSTYRVEELDANGYTVTVNGKTTSSKDVRLTKEKPTETLNFKNAKNSTSGGEHWHPTTPVPVIVIPPKTGDMPFWYSIARFLGLVK